MDFFKKNFIWNIKTLNIFFNFSKLIRLDLWNPRSSFLIGPILIPIFITMPGMKMRTIAGNNSWLWYIYFLTFLYNFRNTIFLKKKFLCVFHKSLLKMHIYIYIQCPHSFNRHILLYFSRCRALMMLSPHLF